jgi:hypothetical protein
MINKFLKAKHWQIFLLTFGIPFVFQILIIPFTIIFDDPMIVMKIMPIVMIIFLLVFLGWFYSIAIGLQKLIPEEIRLNITKFKIFLFIPLVYIAILSLKMGLGFESIINETSDESIGLFMGIIVPLHLFSMFCLFYCLYFVAKTFKTSETQKKVTFSDFAGEFFLIWFFPIGIWIVQPKINQMIKNKIH